jgi:hypothetical protein
VTAAGTRLEHTAPAILDVAAVPATELYTAPRGQPASAKPAGTAGEESAALTRKQPRPVLPEPDHDSPGSTVMPTSKGWVSATEPMAAVPHARRGDVALPLHVVPTVMFPLVIERSVEEPPNGAELKNTASSRPLNGDAAQPG